MELTRWTVLLADGTYLGDVEADTYEEALAAAILLAATMPYEPQRLLVGRHPGSNAN